MVRTGLLRPSYSLMEGQIIETRFQKVFEKLSDLRYLVIVADTGALRRAAISFLHKSLSRCPHLDSCSRFCDERSSKTDA